MSSNSVADKKTYISNINARYDAAIDRANLWLSRTRSKQARLAELIGVSPSSVSRFIKRVPGYTPQSNRPVPLKILKWIESNCLQFDQITEMKFELSDDPHKQWQDMHYYQNLQLRKIDEEESVVDKLLRTRVISIQATHGPIDSRGIMCRRTLVTIAKLIDNRPIIPERALQSLMDDVASLKLEGLKASRTVKDKESEHKILGYSGLAMLKLAFLSKAKEKIKMAIEDIASASSLSQRAEDGHWKNLIMGLEAVFEADKALGLDCIEIAVSNSSFDSVACQQELDAADTPMLSKYLNIVRKELEDAEREK